MTRLDIKALVTDSRTGKTARYLAAYRGDKPVLAICYDEPLIRQLALCRMASFHSIRRNIRTRIPPLLLCSLKMLIENGYLHFNDKVAYLSGGNSEGSGATFLEINAIDSIFADQKAYLLPNF